MIKTNVHTGLTTGKKKKCFAKDAYAYDGLKENKDFDSGYWNCKPDNKTLTTTTKATITTTTEEPIITPPITPLNTLPCLSKDTKADSKSLIRTVPNVYDSAGCQFACLSVNDCLFWAFESTNKECSLLKDDKDIEKGKSPNFTHGPKFCNPKTDQIQGTSRCEKINTSHWYHNIGDVPQPSGVTNKDECISD